MSVKRSARHDHDVISLVFGTLFAGAALFWGLVNQQDLPGRGWYLPVLLIAVGLVGLLGSLAKRDPRDAVDHPYSDATTDQSDRSTQR